jgi:hypothetical protein
MHGRRVANFLLFDHPQSHPRSDAKPSAGRRVPDRVEAEYFAAAPAPQRDQFHILDAP